MHVSRFLKKIPDSSDLDKASQTQAWSGIKHNALETKLTLSGIQTVTPRQRKKLNKREIIQCRDSVQTLLCDIEDRGDRESLKWLQTSAVRLVMELDMTQLVTGGKAMEALGLGTDKVHVPLFKGETTLQSTTQQSRNIITNIPDNGANSEQWFYLSAILLQVMVVPADKHLTVSHFYSIGSQEWTKHSLPRSLLATQLRANDSSFIRMVLAGLDVSVDK